MPKPIAPFGIKGLGVIYESIKQIFGVTPINA